LSDQRFQWKLPNGLTVEVDEQTYLALHQLESSMCLLATGGISNFVLVEVDVEGRERNFILNGEYLEVLHRELNKQSMAVLDAAKSWKGNAPPTNQSRRRH
jgi:hypothetical protein